MKDWKRWVNETRGLKVKDWKRWVMQTATDGKQETLYAEQTSGLEPGPETGGPPRQVVSGIPSAYLTPAAPVGFSGRARASHRRRSSAAGGPLARGAALPRGSPRLGAGARSAALEGNASALRTREALAFGFLTPFCFVLIADVPTMGTLCVPAGPLPSSFIHWVILTLIVHFRSQNPSYLAVGAPRPVGSL